jgi:hypothetical protein
MTFDKPEHKAFVLEMLKSVQIPMTAARLAVELQDAVEAADIKPVKQNVDTR